MYTHRKRAVICAMALACCGAALAFGAEFALSKAIPADAYMAVHARHHKGMEFLDRQTARVFQAIKDAKFENDIKKLIKDLSAGDLEEAKFEEHWQQMNDLCAGVNWSTLFKREFAFGMKQGFPNSEFVFLFQPPAESIGKDFDGLAAMVKTLQGLAPEEMALSTDGAGDRVVHRVSLSNSPFPISMTLAREKDTILVGFGAGFVDQTLALLRGEKGESLASTQRYQEAFKSLPPATDATVFVDVAKVMTQVRGVVSQGLGMAKQYAGDDPDRNQEIAKVEGIAGKAIDAFDLWDYVAEVSTTDGMRTSAETLTVLRADAKSKLMYQPFYGTGTLKDPLKYIPKEASSVTVNSGMDLAALYRNVIGFVKAEIPEAAPGLAEWDAMQEQIELNVERDLLGWMQGNMIQFTIPGPSPFSPPSSVYMLRVSNEAKAQEMLDLMFEKIDPLLKQQGGAIDNAEIEGAEGFRSIIHPMVAFIGMKAPTLGIKDGWLFFGSSAEVIGTAVATSAGKHENFLTNERFKKEAVAPGNNLVSLSFTDQTKLGEELGQMLQMVGMVMGMPMMPPEFRDSPFAQFAKNVIGKAGRVARTLDYFQSNATMTTMDGNRLLTKMVQNYRESKSEKSGGNTTGTGGGGAGGH